MLKRMIRSKRRRVIVLISRDINKGSQAKMPETIREMQFDSVTIYCVDISRALSAFLKKPDYPRPANGGIPAEAMPAPIAGGGGPQTQTSVIQQMDGNALNGVDPILRSIHDLFKKTPAQAFTYFTGGRVYNFASERGLEKAIKDIGLDLNSQYVLSYAPTRTPVFRTRLPQHKSDGGSARLADPHARGLLVGRRSDSVGQLALASSI